MGSGVDANDGRQRMKDFSALKERLEADGIFISFYESIYSDSHFPFSQRKALTYKIRTLENKVYGAGITIDVNDEATDSVYGALEESVQRTIGLIKNEVNFK